MVRENLINTISLVTGGWTLRDLFYMATIIGTVFVTSIFWLYVIAKIASIIWGAFFV